MNTGDSAIRAKDIDRLMAVYSPDIVYFDLCLRCDTGGRPLGGGDVAVAHMCIARGTIANQRHSDGTEIRSFGKDQ